MKLIKAILLSALLVVHLNAAEVKGDLKAETVTIEAGAVNTGFIEMGEISDPPNPAADKIRIYINDVGGISKLMYRDSAGTETEVGATGATTLEVNGASATDANFVDTPTIQWGLDTGDTPDSFTAESVGSVIYAQKGSAGTINAGDVVYVSGYDLGADVTEVELADSDNASAMPAIGIAYESFSNVTTGRVIVSGKISGLDTSSLSEGDEIYVSTTAGAFTGTVPTGAAAAIQKIGIVERSHVSQGVIGIVGAGHSNAVPNLDSATFFLGNASGQAVAVTMSGDATLSNTGVLALISTITRDSEWDSITKIEAATSSNILLDDEGVQMLSAVTADDRLVKTVGTSGRTVEQTGISIDASDNIAVPGTLTVGAPSNTILTVEGATEDAFEGTLVTLDPTADWTWTLPDETGTLEVEGHAPKHQNGGADEIATATPGANAIPKAGAGGNLAVGFLPRFTETIALNGPANYTNGHIQIKKADGWTISEWSCSTDVGTVDIQFDERAEGTPNTAGTDIASSALQCTTTTASSTSFTNAAIAANAPLSLDIDATASSPTVVRIYLEWTYD